MIGTIRALEIIATKDIRSPRQFAKEMWPDSMGWQRRHKLGRGTGIGTAMALAGGGFLGKLRRQNLIRGGYNYERITLTEEGREKFKLQRKGS